MLAIDLLSAVVFIPAIPFVFTMLTLDPGVPIVLCRPSGVPGLLAGPNRLPTEMAVTMMIYSIANERL